MSVTRYDIRAAIQALELSRQPVCVHSSLRSFGHVDGGAQTVVDAFLDEGCTLMAPSFSWTYATHAPKHLRPRRNGTNDVYLDTLKPTDRIYTPDTPEIDKDMGAIAATVVASPGRERGNHPIGSFSAVGPCARDLTAVQAPDRIYGPLARLAELGGYVLLMGVELASMTLLHFAEQRTGRVLFRRWANDRQGEPMMVESGGCSDGFYRFEPVFASLRRRQVVGRSTWQCFPAGETLRAAVDAIHGDPMITHCGNPGCGRCNDAVAGGPILKGSGSRGSGDQGVKKSI